MYGGIRIAGESLRDIKVRQVITGENNLTYPETVRLVPVGKGACSMELPFCLPIPSLFRTSLTSPGLVFELLRTFAVPPVGVRARAKAFKLLSNPDR